jgi:tetratricopeptide (TPR) repeat protein
VPEARLKRLARAGLFEPERGPRGPVSFGFRDLLLLRTTKDLLESGVPMRRIRRIWSSLRDQISDDVPLTSITIRADGKQVVASDGHSAWRPDSGQVLLDFEPADSGAKTLADPMDARHGPPGTAGDTAAPQTSRTESAADLTAEQLYEAALDLETSAPPKAIETYLRALDLDPYLADAHVNLGRLYHRSGERGRAEAHYRDAVRLAPEDPVPHFNLGTLLEEMGRREEAVLAYGQAVSRDPEFADAHCNLGLLLESLGRRREAMQHLMTARELYQTPE